MNLHRRLLIIAVTLLPGFSLAQQKPAVDPSLIAAYVTPVCPSELNESKSMKMSAFGATILGLGIDYVIDKIGSALSEAAAADKSGQATKAVIPSYLYSVAEPAVEPKPGSVAMPGCIVVAIADSPPDAWCKLAPFVGNGICDAEPVSIPSLLKPIPGFTAKTGKGSPKFYAEIVFIRSVDSAAFMPKLAALYYPLGISTDAKFKGKKPRSLSLTVSASTPGGEAALTTVSIVLKDFVPQPELIQRAVSRTEDGRVNAAPDAILDKAAAPIWHAIAKAPAKIVGAKGDPIVPINLTAEIREIGDPNLFLQVLANVFATQKDALKAEAKSSFIPSMASAADQKEKETALTNDAAFDGALAQAYGAETNLRNVCAKATPSKSEVLAVLNALSAAQTNVRKVELLQGKSTATAFSPDLDKTTFDGSKEGSEICKQVLPK